MNDLPALGKIRASTAATDLQIIGIDEDYKSEDARALLKKRGYDWQDFHLNRKTLQQLSLIGVPVVVLTDAAGTIVYYHTGGGRHEGPRHCHRKTRQAVRDGPSRIGSRNLRQSRLSLLQLQQQPLDSLVTLQRIQPILHRVSLQQHVAGRIRGLHPLYGILQPSDR